MTEKLAKVNFELNLDEWHGGGVESVWAEPVAGKKWEHFRIMNSPFYVTGVSFLDVVKASFIAGSYRVFNFEAVVERSGHSTYMILMVPEDPRNEAYWDMLERMGCTYESSIEDLSVGQRLLYSVDAPPSTEIDDVYEMLERGETDKVWTFQEGFVSPAHKTQD